MQIVKSKLQLLLSAFHVSHGGARGGELEKEASIDEIVQRLQDYAQTSKFVTSEKCEE